jgi:TRAP-type C4-dicarboxylate transport system substrate-binding protein
MFSQVQTVLGGILNRRVHGLACCKKERIGRKMMTALNCVTLSAMRTAMIALVALTGLGFALPAPAQTKADVDLTAAGYAPATHVMHRSLDEFLNNIQKASDGKISASFHPTGSLVSQTDMLQAGRSGTADIVSIATSAFPGEFRFSSDAGTLLFVWNLDNFDKALDVLRPYLEAELKAQNLKPLWMVGTVTEWFMRKPTDLDNPNWTGRKIRGFGGASNRVIEILGGSNITVANNEVPVAASTGVLDGLATSLGSFAPWGIDKQIPCMVTTNDVPLISVIAINADSWAKIPVPLQKLMTDEAAKIQNKYIDVLRSDDGATQAKYRATSACVQDFSDAQRAVWKKKLAPLYDDFRKKQGEKGEKFLADVNAALANH